ncbi:MAG TPA: hypothetical protein VHX38_10510 [Pseudonocardiaceae bacterium]|jgi:hypothetical protein|nr:hypothetical protein [Pseudonocardiaceae bacterium]
MLDSDLPSSDPLLALAEYLIAELPLLGRLCQDSPDPRRRDLVRRYCARRELPLIPLVVWLEQECGLRFADARLPYRHYGATWPHGQPFSGYTDERPGPSPGQWLMAVFSTWKVIAFNESPADCEAHSVFRAALWVCSHAGVTAALHYVLDLVDAGLVLCPDAAAWAASRIAIGAAETSEPRELVARLVEGGAPTGPGARLLGVPSREAWHAEGRSSPAAASALESLIGRGWALVERAREAMSLDEWLPAVLALPGTLRFIARVVTLTLGEVPTEVDAILSQFEELWCDVAVIVGLLEIGENGGPGGLPMFVDYERDLQRRFHDSGDVAGQRFRRERLLLPARILTSGVTAGWTAVGWRIAVPWRLHHIEDARGRLAPEQVAAYGHAEHGETVLARLLLDDVLARSPHNDAAHWLRARTCQLDSDHQGVLDSVLSLLVLRPEQPEGWELLADAFNALGSCQSAEVARWMHVVSCGLSGRYS